MALKTQMNNSEIPAFELNEENLSALKDSTRKLLYVLDQLQKKTTTKIVKLQDVDPNNNIKVAFANIPADAQNDHDDCSVYKKLTRQCSCLTTARYNDLVIHFNANTQHVTTMSGEVIKNIRILKKFIYMGGNNTKRALIFLNDGLKNSSHTERIEIVNACAYADVCNVFEDDSIVTFCITFAFKNNEIGDKETQAQAATLLRNLAELEEGRRYLNFSTKIMGQIKKTIKHKADSLDEDVLEMLDATLEILQNNKRSNLTYYCKPTEEGKHKANAKIKKVSDFIKFKATYQSPYKYERKQTEEATTSFPQPPITHLKDLPITQTKPELNKSKDPPMTHIKPEPNKSKDPSITPLKYEFNKSKEFTKRKSSNLSKIDSLETVKQLYADMFKPAPYDNIIKEPSESTTLDSKGSVPCVVERKKSNTDLTDIDSSYYYTCTAVDVWELPPENNHLEVLQHELADLPKITENDNENYSESDTATLKSEGSASTLNANTPNNVVISTTESETNDEFDTMTVDESYTSLNEVDNNYCNEMTTDGVNKIYTDNTNIANENNVDVFVADKQPYTQPEHTVNINLLKDLCMLDINNNNSNLHTLKQSYNHYSEETRINEKFKPIRWPLSIETESKLRACILIPQPDFSETSFASLNSYRRRTNLKLFFTD